jgi:hypothetical protein
MKLLIDILGWSGAILILLAYFMVSSHRLDGRNRLYQLMNIVGSILLIINTLHYKTYPLFALNMVWMLIAVVAFVQIYLGRKSG